MTSSPVAARHLRDLAWLRRVRDRGMHLSAGHLSRQFKHHPLGQSPYAYRSPVLAGGNLLIVAVGMTVDAVLFTLTLYTQEVLRYSAVQFGLMMATMTVVSVVGSYAGQESGLASGVANTSFHIGGALGVALASTVAASNADAMLVKPGQAPLSVQELTSGYR